MPGPKRKVRSKALNRGTSASIARYGAHNFSSAGYRPDRQSKGRVRLQTKRTNVFGIRTSSVFYWAQQPQKFASSSCVYFDREPSALAKSGRFPYRSLGKNPYSSPL